MFLKVLSFNMVSKEEVVSAGNNGAQLKGYD